MWAWFTKAIKSARNALITLVRFSAVREELSLANAHNAELKEKVTALQTENAELKAELKTEQLSHQKTKQDFQEFKDKHTEQVCVWRTIEYRRGKRTFDQWQAFCPKCHMPLILGESYDIIACSAHCGWNPNALYMHLRCEDVYKFLEFLNGKGETQQESES